MRAAEASLALALLGALGCATGQPALRPLPMPHEPGPRVEAAEALGQALFDGLRTAGVGPLLADGATLDAIYLSAARGRLLAEQAQARRLFPAAPWRQVWAEHAFDGVCLQGDQVAAGALGLRESSWVVDRVLVVARRGDWRSAAWVTGTFVLTTRGFQAIAISAIQPPRPNHADLELVPCDVQSGL